MADRKRYSLTFDVFSRRGKATGTVREPLTPEFRNRVINLCNRTFPEHRGIFGSLWRSKLDTRFWLTIREKLVYLHGRSDLSSLITDYRGADTITFLRECSVEHFFDFIEIVFLSVPLRSSRDMTRVQDVVEEINTFIRVDSLPYHLTGFSDDPSPGASRIESYPKIIRRDNELLHERAVQPTLSLLSKWIFTSANEEFLDALKDFRDGDYRDCVVKCGSSLESVMKVICDRRGWPYQQTDTAGPLLKHILPQTMLDSYFEQPIILIATIRNRLSTAHGAGTQLKTVPKHVASYVINATASAILLLVDETNP